MKKIPILIFIITALSAGALSGCGARSSSNSLSLPPTRATSLSAIVAALPLVTSSTGQVEERGYTVHYEPGPTNASPTILTFTSPNGKQAELPIAIEQFLNDRLANRHVTSFNLPVDPNNPSFIYLSTTQPLDKNFDVLENHLYRYDLIKRELTDLYQEKTTDASMLRTIARDGSYVILFKDSINNSPGPCSALWYDFQNQLTAFDLDHPEKKLWRYHAPPKKIMEAFAQEQTCQANMQ